MRRCELVLVDDGGLDRTGERAIELDTTYPHAATVVRLARNFGQHPAVFAGLAHARGERVVTLDSDLQYPPEEIPHLLRGSARTARSPPATAPTGRIPITSRLITRALTCWLSRQTGPGCVTSGRCSASTTATPSN